MNDMLVIDTMLKLYKERTGRIPTTQEGLMPVLGELKLPQREFPIDPWGNPYSYVASPTKERGYDLYSLGPDRKESPDDIYLQ